VIAAEVGQLELAWDYFGEAALVDLHDLQHNTRDGVHIASARRRMDRRRRRLRRHARPRRRAHVRAAAAIGVATPCLPTPLRDRRLKVEIAKTKATYTLLAGEPLEIGHHGQTIRVAMDEPVTQPIHSPLPRTTPSQPYGRAPSRLSPAADRVAA
jgi:alpha,alpha-trehalose phosphorylase